MDVAVVGTGYIGGILGRALARAGHTVTFGSRHAEDDDVAADTTASVATLANCRPFLPSDVRYARAFNTLGGENMEQPVFADGRADMLDEADGWPCAC